ncbi:MAG: 3-deoxy-7-phosphoheptulonate synthase [Proteobacteria bacterium]|nr:3-deoxy-7-phosphoheptulonate synthase [Pseudomonadota bacterium]
MNPRELQLAPDANVHAVESAARAFGLWTTRLQGSDGHTAALEIQSHSQWVDPSELATIPGVSRVLGTTSGHPRVDSLKGQQTTIGDAVFGAAPVLIAGPCSVDSPEQVHACAAMARAAGATVLRGGAYKPRTSPYSFDGTGLEGLGWLRDAADAHGLAVVTEVMSERRVDAVAEVADLMQVGSRNMQNFALLDEVGRAAKPVLLKRGVASSVKEWLLSAERLLVAGAPTVVLCERGIRGDDGTTRNLLDLGAVALLKRVHGLNIVVDPSHAIGRRDLIGDLAAAALACGADGLMIEIHPDPASARCDGPQALGDAELERVGALIAADPRSTSVPSR